MTLRLRTRRALRRTLVVPYSPPLWRVLLAACVALLLPASLLAQPAAPLQLPYTQFTLPNGLHVILHEDHSTPIVTVNVWYHVGSAREKPGRTGFAHLFEHLMFTGSGHVDEGEFDTLLEAAGGNNNGSTEQDRTNYVIDVPSNALELALFLESDRMGYLVDSMSPQRVDQQRDVVKNERRQSVENRPYGSAEAEVLTEMLYPVGHPYHWPVVGYMDDLTAASYDDVVAFFKTYYAPGNASLVVAGDIDPVKTRALVEKWFGDVKPGAPVTPITIPGVRLNDVQKKTITDRVQLPRLYLAWLTPASLTPGDAALDLVADVLAGGKNSRLYKRLVFDMQIAQNVSAYQNSQGLSSYFLIRATPQPGHTPEELKTVIDEEIARLKAEPPTEHEVQRSINQIEASFYSRMERVGGFSGKADQLNRYYTDTGDPDWFNEDLARYRAISATDIRAAAQEFLPSDRRVELTVVPESRPKP
ncbi:MAG TPA: pitrilysin family protein [Vicinamibacterales bacterium]|nr:pitrilysin family protein [Vicinamibacterales bacterium]